MIKKYYFIYIIKRCYFIYIIRSCYFIYIIKKYYFIYIIKNASKLNLIFQVITLSNRDCFFSFLWLHIYILRKNRDRKKKPRIGKDGYIYYGIFIIGRYGLVWFYGISTFVTYLMPHPFYTYKQFHFKQFNLA